jgi:hypothetical protein
MEAITHNHWISYKHLRRKTAIEIVATVWFKYDCPECEEAQYWTWDLGDYFTPTYTFEEEAKK